MDWQDLDGKFSMAKVESGVSIDQAMTEFFQHIRDNVIPKNDGVAWDYLRVEFWTDSGRMIVFPSSSTNSERIEKAGCQVVFSDLMDEYENLADSDLDDDDFEAEIARVKRMWIERFLNAARTQSLLGHRIEFWDGEGEESICDSQV